MITETVTTFGLLMVMNFATLEQCETWATKLYDLDSGGCFELYDTNLQKHKSIPSKLNTCIFFATNNKTYHGVNEVKEGYRKLLSIWYYTKEPTKDLSKEPHRTLWVK